MSMTLTVLAVTPAEVQQLRNDPAALAAVERAAAGRGDAARLEKSWHGLHFLLTGEASGGAGPEAFLLRGGDPFGGDRGYGPARLVRPDGVHAVHAALAAASDEQVWSRFDPERMTAEGIYPVIWDEPAADLRDEYLGYLAELRAVVASASECGGGLVLILE